MLLSSRKFFKGIYGRFIGLLLRFSALYRAKIRNKKPSHRMENLHPPPLHLPPPPPLSPPLHLPLPSLSPVPNENPLQFTKLAPLQIKYETFQPARHKCIYAMLRTRIIASA